MQIYPNPVANVAAKVPGLLQAAAGLQFAASPLFNANQGVYHTGEGSLFGLGAIESWRRTSPPPVLGAYEMWRMRGLGRMAVAPSMVALGQAEAAVANGGNGAAVEALPPFQAAIGIGGAAIAITVAMGVAGAIFGGMHGWARHKKPGWTTLWSAAGFLFPGYTIAAGVAQRQVSGWRRGRR